MTELELHQPQSFLADQMKYAQAVSTAALLPQAYRGKPADIMLAMGLGQAMGLSPAESLYRIDVIQGKPTASAELIAANVRKAGHKLRVKIDEANVSVTATIVRSDDPEDPHPPTITRDRKWAQDMGLASKDNYKKQPLTMLQWRAITAVARLACPEALYGVAYTADEMYDMPGVAATGGLGAVLSPQVEVEQVMVDDSPLLNVTSKLAKAMYASINDAGVTEDERLPYIRGVIGRDIESSKEMTEADARLVLDSLNVQDEAAGA